MEKITIVVTWDDHTTEISITQPHNATFKWKNIMEAWNKHPDHAAAMKAKNFHLTISQEK